jgi:hypothetical protein
MKRFMNDADTTMMDRLLMLAMRSSDKPSVVTAERAVELIERAERYGVKWPRAARRHALRMMCFEKQKQKAKEESIVLVTHDGHVVAKATRVGHKARKPSGSLEWQQVLIHELSWSELREWVARIATQIDSLQANLSMAARLFEMREMVPDSAGPGDAALQLGTTVQEWIERAS